MASSSSTPSFSGQAYTVTFGDRGEGHVGAEIIGKGVEEGLTVRELYDARIKFRELGCECLLFDLRSVLPPEIRAHTQEAAILIVRGGFDKVAGEGSATQLWTDLKAFPLDKHIRRMRKVSPGSSQTAPILQNKNARHNLCFGDYDKEPDIINGVYRVVDFSRIPLLDKFRKKLPHFLGPKASPLIGELNHYYDITKCGIGPHGDTERKIVIAVRLGDPFPMRFQWFLGSKSVSSPIDLPELRHGDVYIMSEKTVGYDWKRKVDRRFKPTKPLYTLRHSAGAPNYLEAKAEK